MAAPEFPRCLLFYRKSDLAWLRPTLTGNQSAETIKAQIAESYGWHAEAIGVVEVTHLRAEEFEKLRHAKGWGGTPPDCPVIDDNAPPPLEQPIRFQQRFDDTHARMTEAYRRLYLVERQLRVVIENTLFNTFGNDWFEKMLSSVDGLRDQVTKTKADHKPELEGIADPDPSPMRHVDFGFLRPIIRQHPGRFPETMRTATFRDRMEVIEPFRVKIAHCYVLEADDLKRFREAVDYVVKVSQAYVQPR